MSPTVFRVRSMSQAAEDLHMSQLLLELEFYKSLSLEYGSQLEGIAEVAGAGGGVSIVIGRRPPAVAFGRKGRRA